MGISSEEENRAAKASGSSKRNSIQVHLHACIIGVTLYALSHDSHSVAQALRGTSKVASVRFQQKTVY